MTGLQTPPGSEAASADRQPRPVAEAGLGRMEASLDLRGPRSPDPDLTSG